MNNKTINVGFTVDAGLIQRLGYELVGRAETALSELIKNSYDADATLVDVEFINTDNINGSLIIRDNGMGMTQEQLINGFMRISSSDKLHNPISEKFKRTKAGRKGIGRFATQRLGDKLTIITQTANNDFAIKLTIDWNQYEIDKDITTITFPISYIEKECHEGTTLIIDNLREKWSIPAINRVYRYIMDLFQPDYLSLNSRKYNYATYDENYFRVVFSNNTFGNKEIINSDQISIFDKSLATIEGYIDKNHLGYVSIKSESLCIDDIQSIEYCGHDNDSNLLDIYFKIHYFIYNRPQYYRGKISNIELNKINELSKTASGVRLYRNGFRVLPYGEVTDDWTQIDRRWSSESGTVNVPLSNKNLFGFVEISDPNGSVFEETASREGLIENDAFRQLTDFVHKSLLVAKSRIAEKITQFKDVEDEDNFTQKSIKEEQSEQELLESITKMIQGDNTQDNDPHSNSSTVEKALIIKRINRLIEETGMLRVLAGLGLSIGEFTHEIKQYQPSIYGLIHQLRNAHHSDSDIPIIDGLLRNFEDLFSYTRYFSATISQNTNREKSPIDLLSIVDHFKNTIRNDLHANGIILEVEEFDFDVYTIPMHKSEWSSMLFNLYSNSRKAIRRKCIEGKILIEVGINDKYVFLRFNDNGDGIPEKNKHRVFNAFFSTSTPASFDAPQNEQLVGTGLGLKIIKDIVGSYKGTIKVVTPTEGYATCFEIKIPKNIS